MVQNIPNKSSLTLSIITGGAFWLGFLLKKCQAQEGVDAGGADPLGFGLIDPGSLEIAATYVYIVPFVFFTIGIVVIPAVLVITYLIILPFFVPLSGAAEGRSFRDGGGGIGRRTAGSSNNVMESLIESAMTMLSRSECFNRVICEVSYSRNVNGGGSGVQTRNDDEIEINGKPRRLKSQRRRKVRSRSSCSRFNCVPYDFMTSLGNSRMK